MRINHFKANILMLAKEQGLTLAQLAKKAGYKGKAYFNHLFTRGFDMEDVVAVAEALGVDPLDLLDEVSPEDFGKTMADSDRRVEENLKMICAEHGMTKSEVAREIGYTRPVFEKMFRKDNPRQDIIENVCYYFDIDEKLLTGFIDYERYGEALIPRYVD